jgi:hypothetical protein
VKLRKSRKKGRKEETEREIKKENRYDIEKEVK